MPDSDLTFADLGLEAAVLRAVTDVGYETPSRIQAATIPTLLTGQDVVGLAQTGTGKTAAFALPILSRLDVSKTSPQALVLAPTRELALQVCEAFERYAAHLGAVHVLPVYGGQGYGVQLSALRRGVHIVVGTPGRIMDHLEKGTLDLSGLRFLVLDEADEMLSMGFSEDVETILASTPDTKQVALFSATMPRQIKALSKKYLHNPAEIAVERTTVTAENITQRYLMVAYPQKLDALTRILEVENFESMIVFVRTKQETESLAERLRARGFSAAAINGDVVQQQRERTVAGLREGAIDLLVATDVAARGLDVERISHVVNYDLPTDPDAYVHRIGRTGRAGRSGHAISFVTPRERHLLRAIERTTRSTLQHMTMPTVDEVNSTRLARFDDAITAALTANEGVAFFRDVVGHYVSEYNVPEVDVAAALAAVLHADVPLLLEPDPEPEPQRERKPAGRERSGDWETYRIDVGRRQRIEPRQIVGAFTNEGGLTGRQFGAITIKADFSLVELPASLSMADIERLTEVKVSGKTTNLRLDAGPGGGRPRRGDKPWKRNDGPKWRDGAKRGDGPKRGDGAKRSGWDRDGAGKQKFSGESWGKKRTKD
ncbi:MAG: DEAD/DEAH box helicase [Nocardioides sp.]